MKEFALPVLFHGAVSMNDARAFTYLGVLTQKVVGVATHIVLYDLQILALAGARYAAAPPCHHRYLLNQRLQEREREKRFFFHNTAKQTAKAFHSQRVELCHYLATREAIAVKFPVTSRLYRALPSHSVVVTYTQSRSVASSS